MAKKVRVFNPVKEDKDGVMAKRLIWSTDSLEMALDGLKAGRKLVANPFYENNSKLLKGDLVFDRTQEEIQDWKKCSKDILYFASKCKLMTPEGIKHVTLRDYQEKYLKHLVENRLSIYLACRQCAKCSSLITKVLCKFDKDVFETLGDKLKNRFNFLFYIKEQDCYNIPLFELYNIYDKRLIWKIKYNLYKCIYKLLCLQEEHLRKTTGKE